MNQRFKILMHIVFWAFMFLSPLQYMRGSGTSMNLYFMNCMSPLMLMTVFYVNYLWLTPRYFVSGKHRYFLLINAFMVITLGIALHYWMDFTHDIYQPLSRPHRIPDNLDNFLFIVRDTVNLAIFAIGATCIALAQRWYETDKARKDAVTAHKDAELRNLRNQINPHFLLNTLNNIYALTAFDTNKAQEAIQELSKMLRHILYDYQQSTVPLKDEVEFLDNYIKLMKLRLPQSIDVVFKHAISDSQIEVAPMLFISLVENAFKHGVSPTEPSFIHISISGDKEEIICDITNSNFPKAATDHSGHGIGLLQVEQRLELAYPQHYTWEKGVSDDGKSYRSVIRIKK